MSLNIFNSIITLCTLTNEVKKVYSHSWLECTDYDESIAITSNDYDESGCSGWARRWGDWGSTHFGEDKGQHNQITNDNPYVCDKTIGSPDVDYSDSYEDEYPMAQYTVGDDIRVLWPAKNHANDADCRSYTERDHGLQMLVNLNVNPTEDNNDIDEWTIVKDWHADSGETWVTAATGGNDSIQSNLGIEGVPFSQCPYFCDDWDLAICYGDFVVPSLFTEEGVYTFMWYWQFKATSRYTHCFEVYVTIPDVVSSPTMTPVEPSGTREPSTFPTTPTMNPTESPAALVTLSLENVGSVNKFFYACEIHGVDDYYTLSSVLIANDDNDWRNYSTYNSNTGKWGFSSLEAWSLPFDVKVVNTQGGVITHYGLITSFTTSEYFDFDTNFGYVRVSTDRPTSDPTDNPTNDPTSEPSNDPTGEPTTVPTVSPVATISDPITLTKISSSTNFNYLKLVVSDVANGVTVAFVEVRDSGANAMWSTGGYQASWGQEPWIFSSTSDLGREWELPLDVRITSDDGVQLTANAVMTTYEKNDEYNFGQNFESSQSISNVTQLDVTNYIIYVAIGVVCLLLILTLIAYKKYKDSKSTDGYGSNEDMATAIASPTFKGLDNKEIDVMSRRGTTTGGAAATAATGEDGKNIGQFTTKLGQVKAMNELTKQFDVQLNNGGNTNNNSKRPRIESIDIEQTQTFVGDKDPEIDPQSPLMISVRKSTTTNDNINHSHAPVTPFATNNKSGGMAIQADNSSSDDDEE